MQFPPSPHIDKRINNQIFSEQVFLIDETGKKLGILKTQEALNMARDRGFDLVQVAEKSKPPVCKIMDFGKFKYRENKKKKHQKKQELKHIRIKLNTGEHDALTKIKNAEKFLGQGHKIRIEIQLRGRENIHRDLAYKKLEEFIQKIEIKIKTEQPIKKSGRGLDTIICQE